MAKNHRKRGQKWKRGGKRFTGGQFEGNKSNIFDTEGYDKKIFSAEVE